MKTPEQWSVWRNVTFDWWYSWDVGILRGGLLHTLPHVWFAPWNRKKAQAIVDALNTSGSAGNVGVASPAEPQEGNSEGTPLLVGRMAEQAQHLRPEILDAAGVEGTAGETISKQPLMKR